MAPSNPWLNDFAHNVYSQNGEDGILLKALEVIRDTDAWCVEFGAWDGIHLSNTYNLIHHHGYAGVLIEGDPDKYQDLVKTHRGNEAVIPLHAYIGFSADDNLDTVLRPTPIPLDFDLLSIDIDGNDYHAWEAVRSYRPKVVCIEFNPTIPNEVNFVQACDMAVSQGNSLLAFCRLAASKGYQLICTTRTNAIFVDEKYFDRFGITSNALDVMRLDDSDVTYLFTGYDGTVFLKGNAMLLWHDLPLSEARAQQLPKFLREFPPSYNRWRRFAFRQYQKLRRR